MASTRIHLVLHSQIASKIALAEVPEETVFVAGLPDNSENCSISFSVNFLVNFATNLIYINEF